MTPIKKRNPVARSPILRKGGAHDPGNRRAQDKKKTKEDAERWTEEQEERESGKDD